MSRCWYYAMRRPGGEMDMKRSEAMNDEMAGRIIRALTLKGELESTELVPVQIPISPPGVTPVMVCGCSGLRFLRERGPRDQRMFETTSVELRRFAVARLFYGIDGIFIGQCPKCQQIAWCPDVVPDERWRDAVRSR